MDFLSIKLQLILLERQINDMLLFTTHSLYSSHKRKECLKINMLYVL